MAHRFHFFRAGGVDQVSLRGADDLRALPQLDRKLWVALAMPVNGVDVDAETLKLLDGDKDGKVHVDDILATTAWACATFRDPGDVLTSATEVRLDAIANAEIAATAKQMLSDLGKPTAAAITFADVLATTTAFADTKLNGDGIVTVATASDPDLVKTIEDGIAALGGATDRSGKPGLDQAKADEFFAEVDKRAAWLARGKDITKAAIGDATLAAADAFAAVRTKLDDYFTRSRVAAFDPRGAAALGGQEADLIALASKELATSDDALAKLPLGRIDASGRLSLAAVNPAWAARIATFRELAVVPLLGARDALTAADVAAIADKLAPFEGWRADKPVTKVDALEPTWIEKLALPPLRADLKKLIDDDAALKPMYEHLADVTKTVRLRRDFGRVLRNFVNFSDFYSKRDGVFQAGRLFLDARELHLCVLLTDSARHAALDGGSDAFLIYLDVTRDGKTQQIVAALTNGDADHVSVGRNGLYYDRAGNDYDATITKLISNPISIREAFWAPYKKVVKTIEDQVAKRAAKADAEANAKLETAATKTADAVPLPPAPGAVVVPPPAADPKVAADADKSGKLDIGTVAAIGIAIGGIGGLVATIMGILLGFGWYLPFAIAGVMLMISTPSMLLAWLKLRRRNLGPILDANGWAINGRARINVAFGATLTSLPALPKDAIRSLDDPYADKKPKWKRYVFLAAILALAVSWYLGKLDPYLPHVVRSTSVLGDNAPAAHKEATTTTTTTAPGAAATTTTTATGSAAAK